MFNLTKKHKLVFLILIETLLIYLIYMLGKVPGSSGYEASIYAMYLNTFWLIYFIIYLSSLCVLIYSIFVKHDRLSFSSCLFNIIVLNLILYLLPFFRDYFTIDLGDSSAHLGYIKDILSTHHVGTGNPYPISHILSASVALLTQIKVVTIGQTIPLFYYLIYILFAWLLAKKLYRNSNKSMLLTLFILIPILRCYYYYQSLIFFLLIPMLLYAFLRDDKSIRFRYILVIMAFLFPLLHPSSFMLLMMLIAIICLACYVTRTGGFTLRNHLTLLTLFFVIWLFWTAIQHTTLVDGILRYLGWIAGLPEEYSYFTTYYTGWVAAKLGILDTLSLWINIFGPKYLLFGMASIFSIHSMYSWIRKGNVGLDTVLSLVFLAFIVLNSFSFFITSPMLGARLDPYVLLISILVNVSYLFNVVNACKTKIKRITSLIVMIVLLFSTTYIATFGVYNSPFTKNPPEHCTYMYLDSMEWLLQTRNRDLPIEEVENIGGGAAHYLIAIYMLGVDKAILEPNIFHDAEIFRLHFNYPEESLLAKTLKEDGHLVNDAYFVVNKKEELITTKIYPGYEHKFTPDDYVKLEYDKSLNKIYHNGEVKIFYIDYVFAFSEEAGN